jgi:hypothetical protein
MKNCNLPPIRVYVWDNFLFDCNQKKGKTGGHLISVRCRQNQALQFTVLLDDGALFAGLPSNSISFKSESDVSWLPLIDTQMWDCVSDDIEFIQLETILYASCSVKTETSGIINGSYLFTLDFVGEGFSRHPTHWKQLHAIETEKGHLILYPQYRIRFTDKALLEKKELPSYIANTHHWKVGS